MKVVTVFDVGEYVYKLDREIKQYEITYIDIRVGPKRSIGVVYGLHLVGTKWDDTQGREGEIFKSKESLINHLLKK